MTTREVDTPHGPARAHLHLVDEPRAALVLGHGAGGGVTSRDLVAVTGAARSDGIGVVLVEQPYRVAGRRSPAPAPRLDAVLDRGGRAPARARRVPVLVVQGERDPFGIPPAAAGRTVVRVPGDHGLKTDLDAVTAAVGAWLRRVLDM